MKVYYIFKMKKQFISLYKDTPSVLYNILKNIYYLDKEEVDYGYNLFNQLTNEIPKYKLDQSIYIKLHQDVPYSKKGQVHYINNLYKDEISRLEIKRSYIKLETEQPSSTFFSILENYSENLFFYFFVLDLGDDIHFLHHLLVLIN